MASKKRNDIITNILLVVVSAILVMVVSVSFTVAWFSSRDIAIGNFSMGGAVIVEVANDTHVLNDDEPLKLEYSADSLIPGIKILPTIYASLKKSTTTAVLRARIDTSVTGLSSELNEQLRHWFSLSFSEQIDYSWRYYEEDGWYYFLGSEYSFTMVMTQPANSSGLTAPVYGTTYANYIPSENRNIVNEDTVLGSVYAKDANLFMPFLTKPFRLPYHIDNRFANATITLTFYVEALQDYILNEEEENVLPTVGEVKRIMDTLSTPKT